MKACEGVDYVLHQAAWGSVPRSIEKPILYEEINIKGTLNMMKQLTKWSKEFVYGLVHLYMEMNRIYLKKRVEKGNYYLHTL